MKKILCPTDFSAAGQNGVAYAAKFANAAGAQLVLLNVQSLTEVALEGLASQQEEIFEDLSEELEKMSAEIASTFKISCYSKVQASGVSIAHTIASEADHYDMVIMGTNGPDDVFQFLAGSNAYKASVKTTTPVMLIPEGCTFSQIKNVVYAFDYLKTRKLPLAQIIPWLKLFKAEISVLQVIEEANSKEVEDEIRELQFISQTLYAEEINLKFDTIRAYEVAESIHSYILKTQPDVLALCTVHRSLLERFFHNSLIRNLSSVATYPILVFHR